jgi:hypothetical protein
MSDERIAPEDDYVVRVEQTEPNVLVKYFKSGKKETLIQFAKELDPQVKSAALNSVDLRK